MNFISSRTTRSVVVAITLGCCVNAFAGQELMMLDSHARAKVAREKIRSAAKERQMKEQGKSLDSGSCGSQSIGNVDTGGRSAAAPREVFVFAPNAINIVGRGSCQ